MSILVPALAMIVVTLGTWREDPQPGSIARLADLELLARPRTGRLLQVSSADPTGGNDDGFTGRAAHLVAEGNQKVLLDSRGPGVLHRIWSANPGDETLLRFYYNDEQEPRLVVTFAELLSGKHAPFLYPLAGRAGGGYFSYVPIGFQKALRITAEGSINFFQMTYSVLPAGVTVEEAPLEDSRARRSDRAWIRSALLKPWPRPVAATVPPRVIQPLESETLWSKTGPGAIEQLVFQVASEDPRYRRKTVVRLFWDGEQRPAVEAPLGDLFGCGFREGQIRSLPLAARDGVFVCRFVMPFREEARLQIENGSEWAPLSVSLHAMVGRRSPFPFGESRLHARFRSVITRPSVPYEMLDVDGAGHFVGCVMSFAGPGDLRFLEGDESIRVDDEKIASVRGTGTEDFFNGGWYFRDGPFNLYYHGVTHLDPRAGQVGAYRFMVTDAVPFSRHIRVELEHGGGNDAPGVEYSSVAFWYQYGAGNSMFQPLQARRLEHPKKVVHHPRPFIGAASREVTGPPGSWRLVPAERLDGAVRGARYLVCSQVSGGRWEIPFIVDVADRYRITLIHATLQDGVEVSIGLDDGEDLGRIDMRSEHPELDIHKDLGVVSLAAGEHRLMVSMPQTSGTSTGGRIAIDGFAVQPASSFVERFRVTVPELVGAREELGAAPSSVTAEEQSAAVVTQSNAPVWRDLQTRADGFLDLSSTAGDREGAVVYARCVVIAPRAMDVVARLGSDDGFALHLNGRLVRLVDVARSARPDQDQVTLRLREGPNIVLVEVANRQGGCGLFLRFSDPHEKLRYPAP